MGDIKRNNTEPQDDANQEPIPPTSKRVERKVVQGNFVKDGMTQVHFGNVESLKLKFMENISLALITIVDLMDPDGSKRKEIREKKMMALKDKQNG